MKSIKLLAIMLILTCFLGTVYAATPASKMNNQKPVFIENKGQWPAEVKFLAKSPGMNTWITNTGVVYDVYKYDQKPGNQNALKSRMRKDPREFVNNLPTRSGHVIKMEWLKDKSRDAIQASRIDGIDMKAQNLNYFKGKDKSKWASKVPSYSEVMVNTVSQGFRTRYYFEGNKVRYDYILNPGADISNIKMNFDFGEDHQYRPELSSGGELVLKTSVGDVVHGKLFVYQNTDDNKKAEISCNFHINKDSSIGFNVGKYDKSKELIIDPLVYSSFSGSNDDEWGGYHLRDNEGNLVITGYATSDNYPTTTGAYDDVYNGGDFDISVTKYDNTLTQMIYSTFIGGNNWEAGWGIACDNSNNIYIASHTGSNNFPTTAGVISELYNGGYDISLSKLSSAGNQLLYSTYIGGTDMDWLNEIVIDDQDNIYISGGTYSNNFPVTSGCVYPTFNADIDGILLKVNSDASELVFSTYIPGNSWEVATTITLDENNQPIVALMTNSSDFYYTIDFSPDIPTSSEKIDIILLKVNSDASELIFASRIAGSDDDNPWGLDHDAYGNLIFTGYTFSTDFTTTNAFDDSFNGYENSFGLGDAIVVKINPDGDELLFSTFFGGSGDDSGYDLTIDENNHIIVSGVTTSDDIPTSISSYFQDNQGGFSDILIFELSSDGSQLLYSTYFGGEGEDHGYYITNNSDNIVTFTGATTSPNFPVTDDAFNPVFGGGIWFNADNYITVLDISSSLPPEAKCKPATLSLGSNGTVTITPEDIDDGSTGTELSFDIEPSQLTCDNFGDNAVTLTVTDLYGNTSSCNTTVTLSGSAPNCGIAVSPSPAITNGQANTIYLGFGPQSLTLTASGGVSYEWSDGNSIISTNSSVSVSPTQTTTYTLTAYDSYSCSAECTVTIDVLDYTTGNNQMYICHRGTTQRVGKSSVQSHLNHGDYLGPCTNGKEGEGDEPETSEFTLSSNFPNPFSKSTMIEYTLPKAGFVQVKVFDVLSNEVAVLVNQSQAAGHYDIEFNGSGLTPGVYIVRIESQGKSDMMKIVKTE